MVDRFTIPLTINPNADEAASNNPYGPWRAELLRNRVNTEFENPYGAIGEAYSHGPEVEPFDDICVLTVAQSIRHEYARLCDYLQDNPQKLARIIFSADRPSVLRNMAIRVRRYEPTSRYERQKIPLAAYVTQDSDNDLAVAIRLDDVILDSWTFLELFISKLPESAEQITMVVETNGGADVRNQIQ